MESSRRVGSGETFCNIRDSRVYSGGSGRDSGEGWGWRSRGKRGRGNMMRGRVDIGSHSDCSGIWEVLFVYQNQNYSDHRGPLTKISAIFNALAFCHSILHCIFVFRSIGMMILVNLRQVFTIKKNV